MDRGRVVYLLAEVYVLALLAGATLTVAWLLAADVPTGPPELAGLWFAVGGFGVLLLVMFVLLTVSR